MARSAMPSRSASDPPQVEELVASLSDEQINDVVKRSYQYVAMYNVNNKMALDEINPLSSGGYNKVKANTNLAVWRFFY